jgi:uncharacterized membrane protein YhhN
MMKWLLMAVFFMALLEWIAVALGKKKLEYFAKPATIFVLITWVLAAAYTTETSSLSLTWFVIGLSFSLLGDVFLLLPPERWFLWGLAAFMLGLVAYIFGFSVFSLADKTAIMAAFLGFIIVAVGMQIFLRLRQSLQISGRDNLIVPIGIYSLVISYLLFSAAYSFLNPDWTTSEAYLVSVGALLFYISEVTNAWERFVSPSEKGRLKVMVTYHLGQIALAVGATLHFTRLD